MNVDLFMTLRKASSSAGSNPRVFYDLFNACITQRKSADASEVGGSNPPTGSKGLRESFKGINNLSLSMLMSLSGR